jgi:hypothetical protein
MTPLRQTMIQAMCQHGFSPRTQHSYLYVVTALARYYRRSLDQLKVEDLHVFFNYLGRSRGQVLRFASALLFRCNHSILTRLNLELRKEPRNGQTAATGICRCVVPCNVPRKSA